MTGPQADWLRAHPQYRVVSAVPSGHEFTQRGMLRPDGTFVPTGGKAIAMAGGFQVGILKEVRNLERR